MRVCVLKIQLKLKTQPEQFEKVQRIQAFGCGPEVALRSVIDDWT